MSDSSSRPDGANRAATTMPVIEGALAFIVISFVATAWESIPSDRQSYAFEVVFASGAHFIFSFGIVAPAWLLAGRMSPAAAGAFTTALFSYVFWSLIVQHKGLADMLLAEPWQIPMPFANEISGGLEQALGAQLAMFLGPLIFSYAVLVVALVVLWLPSMALTGARKPARAR